MELSKIERMNELIHKRADLLDSIQQVNKVEGDIPPNDIIFDWKSGYSITINISPGNIDVIQKFFFNLLKKELEEVETLIKEL
jgi:hypothetical protein